MQERIIFSCPSLWRELTFFQEGLGFCSCPDGGVFDRFVYEREPTEVFNLEKHIDHLEELYEINQTKNTKCKGCRGMAKCVPSKFSKFDFITIINSYICNLTCSYCNIEQKKMQYAVLPLIKSIKAQDLIHKNTLFQWGGGEPAIRSDFTEVFGYLHEELQQNQHVNTNAVHFSQVLADSLPSNRLSIITSIDAGTSETFLRIRGLDAYDKVCRHVSKYVTANPDRMKLKYIVCKENVESNDLDGFIELCKSSGCKQSIISLSMIHHYAHPISKGMHAAKDRLTEGLTKAGVGVELAVWNERLPKMDIVSKVRNFFAAKKDAYYK